MVPTSEFSAESTAPRHRDGRDLPIHPDPQAMTKIDPTSSESPLWDIRGWKRLTVHEDPPLVAAREEFLAWLAEVPAPHRVDLDARLRSELDYAHLSARLELFVHHYFRSNGWEAQIHAPVAHSSNRPDFLVKKGDAKLVIECRSVFDQSVLTQQDQRLRQLAEEAGKKLRRTIILHPLSDLPPSVPATRIRAWMRQQQITDGNPDLLEFDFWDDYQGHHYGVRALLPRLNDGEESLAGVHGLMSQAQTITTVQRLRAALREKAGKYGSLGMPYVIAVSMETGHPASLQSELDALFGDRVWNLPQRGPATVTEIQNPNGFFTSHRNNVPEYRDVQAVLVYRFKWLDEGHEHLMHIYHNPFATKTIDPELFPKVPQFMRQGETAMGWINGEPEP